MSTWSVCWRAWQTVVAALIGLRALAGCSWNSHGDAVAHPNTTSAPTSTTSTVSPSISTTTPTAAVLAAYRAGWSASLHMGSREEVLVVAQPLGAGPVPGPSHGYP